MHRELWEPTALAAAPSALPVRGCGVGPDGSL